MEASQASDVGSIPIARSILSRAIDSSMGIEATLINALMNTSSELTRIAREVAGRIVEIIHPEKVILFGSAARGEANENSDIDLFIVAKTDKPFPSRMSPIHDILHDMHYPCNVESIIYTPDEFRNAQ